MKITQIINHFREYYIDSPNSDDADLSILTNHFNDIGSLSYFYHITKEIEKNLINDSKISQSQFQMIMTKWFAEAVDSITFYLP